MSLELPIASTASTCGEQAEDQERTFANRLRVLEYLLDAGWQVGKSALYQHVKDRKLVPGPDGDFSMAAVKAYAKSYLKLRDGSRPGDAAERLQRAKLEAEIQRTQAQARRETLKTQLMEGQYITKAQHEQDLADRARVFRADLTNFFRRNIDDFLELVEGNKDMAAQALAWWEEQVEDWLDRYARVGEVGGPEASE